MGLVVKPVSTDLSYQVFFEEPIVEGFKGDGLTTILVNMAKDFGLRLNDIKIDRDAPSDNFIHFFKFEGLSWFDVSYGLEQVRATLRSPLNEEQVVNLYTKLSKYFEHHPVTRQQMNIQQQLSTEGGASSYLKDLNPNIPNGLEKYLHGRGVFYTLKIPDHDLTIHVALASSLFVEGGLYLTLENDFSPSKYKFETAFKVAKEYHDLILNELHLTKDIEK